MGDLYCGWAAVILVAHAPLSQLWPVPRHGSLLMRGISQEIDGRKWRRQWSGRVGRASTEFEKKRAGLGCRSAGGWQPVSICDGRGYTCLTFFCC